MWAAAAATYIISLSPYAPCTRSLTSSVNNENVVDNGKKEVESIELEWERPMNNKTEMTKSIIHFYIYIYVQYVSGLLLLWHMAMELVVN